MGILEFFKPTKRKIVISIAVSIIFYFISALLKFAFQLISPVNYIGPGYSLGFVLLDIFGILIYAIYQYPLSCFISYLIDGGKKSINLKNIVIFIFLLAIFNPTTPLLLLLILSVILTTSPGNCGVFVNGTIPGSLAENAGIQNETILQINGRTTHHAGQIGEILSSGQQTLYITTDKHTYSIPFKGGQLGVYLKPTFCKCGDGICEGTEKVVYGVTPQLNSTVINCAADCN